MNLLQEIRFFKNFPSDLMEQVTQCVELMAFGKGENILEQGQKNNNLYFLENGTLGVYVDKGKVAQLTKKGDLIGEMSLLSGLECSATITAETDILIHKIDGDSLHKLIENYGVRPGCNMYKIYSDILSQKLAETNQKAKKVENLNGKLKAAQKVLETINLSLEEKVAARTAELSARNEDLLQKNTELSAGHSKLKELYNNRDLVFQSMEGLLRDHLIPLKKGLSDLDRDPKKASSSLKLVEEEVGSAIEVLEPLTQSFKNEKSMKNQKVLLAESIRKQQVTAKMALGGTGVELDIVSNLEEGSEQLQNKAYDILIFDEANRNLSDLAKKANPETKFVFVTSDEIPKYVPHLLEHSFFPNVVSRDEEDRQFTIKNFVTTVSKLANNSIFGLEKYLSWGAITQELIVKNSDQRKDFTEKMVSYFQNSGIRSVNCQRCAAVSEELLMNAIYDAPKDKDGNPMYNHLSRTEPVVLQPEAHAKFRYATDGVVMAISVEDQFGGLDAETVFRYLQRGFDGGKSLNDGDKKKGGGGRGLHQILLHSDLVVFNIDPGKKTEVIAIFNADQKSAQGRNPNLHFFTA